MAATKNVECIVFDLGRVLIKWYPEEYVAQRYGESIALELGELVFNSQEWIEMDRGTLDEDELWSIKFQQIPHRRVILEELRERTIEFLEEIVDNTRLLPMLKEKGYRLYVLSNFSARMFERVRAKYRFFEHFDGIVVSSHYGYVKPDPRLYTVLIEKYGVNPEKSLFIDDKLENVDIAKGLGFKVLHLPKWWLLEDELRSLGYL